MNEPSLLDYIKGKLMPWKFPQVLLPPETASAEALSGEADLASPVEDSFADIQPSFQVSISTVLSLSTPGVQTEAGSQAGQEGGSPGVIPAEKDESIGPVKESGVKISVPWLALAALCLAIFAQNSLEPSPQRSWLPGVLFFLFAFICLGMAIYRGEWPIAPLPAGKAGPEPLAFRTPELVVGVALGLLVFLTSGGNRFNFLNSILLLASVLLVLRAFWVTRPAQKSRKSTSVWKTRFSTFMQDPAWTIRITPWMLVVAGLVIVALFFRFWNLEGTPAEMNSDHAEKILDVYRLLQGQTLIFFPNNGGREALQMYLVAGLTRFAGMELGFLTLKFSTALVGFLSLIFIYLLGKEVANPRVGLIAFAFVSVAYWPNVVSRLGLRVPFYIFFTAALLFFIFRGLKNNRRNDLLMAGLVLGFSLYGYSADRILPLVVLLVVGLYLLHPASKPYRKETAFAFSALALVSVILFLPGLRFLLEAPEAYFNRTFSRMGSAERPLPGPVLQIFFTNLWRALTMVSWSGGEVWTISVPFRPALDAITGALYWLGLGLVTVRIFLKRHWIDLSLVLAIPILLLPSVLSLAFPAENPNLYRTGGALVPIFILIALALDGLMTSLESRMAGNVGKIAAWGLALILFLVSSLLSFDLVFKQYDQQYKLSSWNSSEMGQVIRNFGETTGSPETAWVIGFPYWVDTRLVGMMAGQTIRDVAFPLDRLNETVPDPRPKLFILFPQDEAAIAALQTVYPQGTLTQYPSKVPTKDFLIFYVPPTP